MVNIKLTQQQFDRLQDVRVEWSNSYTDSANADRINETVILDGNNIDTVPGFFLELGEAVNGPNGYFGACLDSLSDCLCGGFGLGLPITIEIRNSHVARKRLGRAAIAAWRLVRHHLNTASTPQEEDNASSPESYLELVLEVFRDAGVVVKLL